MRFRTVLQLALAFFLLGILIPATDRGRALPTGNANLPIVAGAEKVWTHTLDVDADGALHILWTDDRTGERDVYYARSVDGSAWSPPVRVDTGGMAVNADHPSLAVERESVASRGRLYVTYLRNGDVWFTSSDDGIAWSGARQLDGPAQAMDPSVAADGGHVVVAWIDYRISGEAHVFLRVSRDAGATWDTETPVSPWSSYNIGASVAIHGDTILATWRAVAPDATVGSARSDDGGATWRAGAIPRPADVAEAGEPSVFLDDAGVEHVAWASLEPASTRILYAWSGDGVNWSTAVRVDDATGPIYAQRVSIGGLGGTIWVVWSDGRNGDGDIFASWSDDGLTWGDGLRNGNDLRVDDTDRNAITTDDASEQIDPVVRTGGFGVYVTWRDLRNGGIDLYFSTVTTSPLVITEVQEAPASEARVELYNVGRTAFDLSRVRLYAGSSVVDLTALGYAPPRRHLVIGATANADLRANLMFPAEGAPVMLLRDMELLAQIGIGERGIAPEQLPGEATARFAGTLDYARAWTRERTPSFGARNLVPAPNYDSTLILNEVLYNANNPGNRYLELYYRGNGTLDLSGYRLISDAEYVLPSLSLTPLHRFALVVPSRATSFFGSLGASGDDAYLYDPGDRLLDMVGWSGPHTQGRSVARAADGVGGHLGFDDGSSAANGWVFDAAPTPRWIDLAPDGDAAANLGDSVRFSLLATNGQAVADYVNVVPGACPWMVTLAWPNGPPLTDSPGDADAIPDLGLVPAETSVGFDVVVAVPLDATGNGTSLVVHASSAANPLGDANVTLRVGLRPYLEVARTIAPDTIYRVGAGPPYPEVAQMTLSVRGAGVPVPVDVAQDVVFQIDVSASMNDNDPGNLRIAAVKGYIDGMRNEDRASVIGFGDTAWVVQDRPLTNTTPLGKLFLKADAGTLACSPFCITTTNIDQALALGNDWLRTYGNPRNLHLEILLTDGICAPLPCYDTNTLAAEAAAAGIVIYTVGLGSQVDDAYLTNIATKTGGRYFHADTANDLLQVYGNIGGHVNRTAGRDPNPRDAAPMVQDVVPSYLYVEAGTFVDPATGLARDPDYLGRFTDRTVLQWNVTRIAINETWSVRYNVRSYRVGVVNVSMPPDARVLSERWDKSVIAQPFPQARLTVLLAPSPPKVVGQYPASGATGVPLNTAIYATFSEPMNASTVAWRITPAVSLSPLWPAPRQLWLLNASLAECTTYTIEITAGRDVDGESLVPGPVPNPWSFTTVCATYVTYTITRSPAFGNVNVDGFEYPVPRTFQWRTGDVHTIRAPLTDTMGASRVAFRGWSDGGAMAHAVTVGSTERTITANYAVQHPALLVLMGLPGAHPAEIRSTLDGQTGSSWESESWYSWVDDGSALSIDDVLFGVAGERWATANATSWTVRAPFSATVEYVHQFAVGARLLGLDGHPTQIGFTNFGGHATAASADSWSAWVDAGTVVSVNGLVAAGARERYRTKDPTELAADAPHEVVISFLHQFRVRVDLHGTDGAHSVGARWSLDGDGPHASGLITSWSDWADAGTTVAFDAATSGDPPRIAQGPTAFLVDRAFDAAIEYAGPAPPPVITTLNVKPMFALMYVATLLIVALNLGRRQRFLIRMAPALPFAFAEGAIGIASWAWGVFRIPEGGSWTPLGFWANTAILAAGLATTFFVARRVHREGPAGSR